MSEGNKQSLPDAGICEWQRRGLSHEPGDYPCGRTLVYDGHPTLKEQGPDIVVRHVRCPKMLHVTNEVAQFDSEELSAAAGTEMVVYKSKLVDNPEADPLDRAIVGYSCPEPPLEFPYLHISMQGLRRQNG